jgi:hypothetical protein
MENYKWSWIEWDNETNWFRFTAYKNETLNVRYLHSLEMVDMRTLGRCLLFLDVHFRFIFLAFSI